MGGIFNCCPTRKMKDDDPPCPLGNVHVQTKCVMMPANLSVELCRWTYLTMYHVLTDRSLFPFTVLRFSGVSSAGMFHSHLSLRRQVMRKAMHLFLGLLFCAGLLAGCQSMTGQTTGEYVDDAMVTTAVKAKLTNNQVASLTRVEVETVNGVVHLTGVAPTESSKAQAGRLAKEVKGVKRVDNDLTIQPE